MFLRTAAARPLWQALNNGATPPNDLYQAISGIDDTDMLPPNLTPADLEQYAPCGSPDSVDYTRVERPAACVTLSNPNVGDETTFIEYGGLLDGAESFRVLDTSRGPGGRLEFDGCFRPRLKIARGDDNGSIKPPKKCRTDRCRRCLVDCARRKRTNKKFCYNGQVCCGRNI